jgi:hypothetical protein
MTEIKNAGSFRQPRYARNDETPRVPGRRCVHETAQRCPG